MEESPIFLTDEDEGDGHSTPSSTSEVNSTHKTTDNINVETVDKQPPPHATSTMLNVSPRNKLLLKSLAPEMSLAATPRSPLPPSPLRRTPSPSETTNHTSTENERDFYISTPLQSPIKPTAPSPANTPTPQIPPERIRLLKALEIRRQKLSGKTIVIIPKIEAPAKRTINEISGNSPPQTTVPPVIKPPSPENKARLIEAKRAAMEEHRRHITALEIAGRDLLCGWVNFQSSTSLVLPSQPLLAPSRLTIVMAKEVYSNYLHEGSHSQ